MMLMPLNRLKSFPLSDNFPVTRVPNAILGELIAEIKDADLICLILRAIWMLERQRGYPKSIDFDRLRNDRVLALRFEKSADFDAALRSCVELGVFAVAREQHPHTIMLNTVSARRHDQSAKTVSKPDDSVGGWENKATFAEDLPTDDAFRAYEENIGILSPIIRENITAALQDFTDEDISQAIRIAVENEVRSWSFVAGILRRWARDGVPHDTREQSTDETRRIPEDQLRKYLDQQRQRI